MSTKITFEKITNQKRAYGSQYDVCKVILRADGKVFDNNRATKRNRGIQNAIRNRYWNVLKALYLPGHTMAVRLSGIHFHIEDVNKYVFFDDRRPEMILHYLEWKDKVGGHVVDAFAIIESNRKLFRQLFHDFWFALGFELRFEGIVLPPGKIYDIEKWSRRIEDPKTYNDLINMSSLILDNLHNGFHFKITSNQKYSQAVENCLSKFLNLETILI